MLPVIIIKPLVLITRIINLVYYHLSRLLEKLGKKPAWPQELSQYFKISEQKVISQYQEKRQIAAKLWNKKNRNTVSKIQSFYNETDYFVYRQNYFNNHKAFFDIALALFLKSKGNLCEYGAGVAPATNWLIKKFPHWQYTLADLNSPTLKFIRWRFKERTNVDFAIVASKLPLKKKYDVIICKQVLEHVPNPLKVIKHFIKHLNSNGWLFLDFIYEPGEENLPSSAKQRKKVLQYLKERLQAISIIDPDNPAEGYGLYKIR